MLTEHVCVHLLLVDVIDLRESGAQTDGIQAGTRTEDLMLRQTRVFEECVGQDVYGVGNHDIGCVGSVFHDLIRDALDDLDVGLRQLESRLSGLSAKTRGDDDSLRADCVAVITRIDVAVVEEGGCLLDVKCLSQRSFGVDVDENDLRYCVACKQRIRGCRSDGTRTDNGYLCFHVVPSFMYA